MAGDPQAAQINLLRHQHTELPPSKYKKKKSSAKPKQSNQKQHGSENYQAQTHHKKRFDPKSAHNNKDRCSKCGDTAHIEGFQYLVKKYQCKACHKFGHFTSLCFQKKQASSKCRRPKAHQLQAGAIYMEDSALYDHLEEDSSSEDSFCLQVKIKCTLDKKQEVSRPIHLITNLAYRLKPLHTRNLYLRARLDTFTDINLMPASVYKLVFNDSKMQKLAPSNLQVGTYTTDTVKIVGSCKFFLVHLDTKKLMEVTSYVAMNDHPKKTKAVLNVPKQNVSTQTIMEEVAAQTPAARKEVPKLITSKEMILCQYPHVFEGFGTFPGPSYNIQIHPSIPPKQTPCRPIPVHLKEMFQQEINKMLQAGVLATVNEATPWINSFVLVESKDKLGNLKLCICLDPTNLNKTITRKPYHFRTPEDIAHLLANACIMTVCDCKKGYCH